MEFASPSSTGVNEQFMHKNRLQEYAQRSALPLPVYQTINEGSPHAPLFRSTVTVDGVTFRSTHTFAHRKTAEQDVAKVALEGITKKIKYEGCPLIRADITFCKSILHEYAAKMNLQKPTYTCTQSEGLLPTFISSVVFEGKTYTGDVGKNKKEAEQLAARTVIELVLGNSSTGTRMSQIIKAKGKLFAAIHQLNGSHPSSGNVVSGGNLESRFWNGMVPGKEIQIAVTNDKLPVACNTVSPSGQLSVTLSSPLAGKKPKEEGICNPSSGPVGGWTPIPYQPQDGPSEEPAGQLSKGVQVVCDEFHLEPLSQVKNQPLCVGPSTVPCDSQGTTSNKKKRSRKKSKGRSESKKVRANEESEMTRADEESNMTRADEESDKTRADEESDKTRADEESDKTRADQAPPAVSAPDAE